MSVSETEYAHSAFFADLNTLFLYLKKLGRSPKTDFRFGISIENYINKTNNFF